MTDRYEDCPIRHLSLHSKLRQCVEAGILEEQPIYRPGFGFGKCLTYNGERITIRRRFKGKPKWDHHLGPNFYFNDFVDLAFCPKTKKLITHAVAL